MNPCLSALRSNLLARLVECAYFTNLKEGRYQISLSFFAPYEKHSLVALLPKFFFKRIEWCGRLYNGDGVTLDPPNYKGIRDAVPSTMAAELCQHMRCLSWMGSATTRLAEPEAPFHALTEASYRKAGRQTKMAIFRYNQKELWSDSAHSDAFKGPSAETSRSNQNSPTLPNTASVYE